MGMKVKFRNASTPQLDIFIEYTFFSVGSLEVCVKPHLCLCVRSLSLQMNPPLDRHPMSQWSTEVAPSIHFLL